MKTLPNKGRDILNHDDLSLCFASRLCVDSHASLVNNTVYISAQTGHNPLTNDLSTDLLIQLHHALQNLQSICEMAGGSLAHIIKLKVFLTDLHRLAAIDELFPQYFLTPMPACTILGVSALPIVNAFVAIDAIMMSP